MKLSMSNLAWTPATVKDIAPMLQAAGLKGVEIAPTAVWPEAPHVPLSALRAFAHECHGYGLEVSGIQSLLFGHADVLLFEPANWPFLRSHLRAMVELAEVVGAQVAVFGSPRNRIRGELTVAAAHHMFVDFVSEIVPVLEKSGVTLTLEPNAPAYGTDYLTTYAEVTTLTDLIGSPFIRPQIDTGCLTMVEDDPVAAIHHRIPHHVHVSAPHLAPLPGDVDHISISQALAAEDYSNWVVLEMMSFGEDPVDMARQAANWLYRTYSEPHS